MNGWKKIRHRLEYLGLLFFARAVPMLSRRACVSVANALGHVAFLIDRRGRTISLANLEVVFGDAWSPEKRREVALASYKNFARTMIDLFWSSRLTRENLPQYIHFEGEDLIPGVRKTAGVVAIGTHCAGFEWGPMAFGRYGLTAVLLSEEFKNPSLGTIFSTLRESMGHETITQDFSMLKLFKHLKRGGHVGILIDLNIPPSQAATIIEEFGMKTCATLIHAMLAQRGGAPIMPVTTETLPDGTCRVILHPPLQFPPDATPQQATQVCWDFFEKRILADPSCWMWAYKHWRYKPRGATRAYPYYANESSKFEKLLREVGGSQPPEAMPKPSVEAAK